MATATLNEDLRGKVAVVTGATTGIGKEIARGLLRMGAEVVIGARSLERGNAAREDIVAATGNAQCSVLALDVADLASVRAFAQEVRAKHPKVHILIHNAGAWMTVRKQTAQGHELTFATNVLGPYVLTTLLEESLRAGAPARVINIVSNLASSYDVTDLEFSRRKYDGFKAYGQSKQALRMVTWALAKRFEGSRVTVNCVAPGFVKTELNRDAHGFIATMINISAKLMAVSPAEGADTPLWAAVSPELTTVTAKYFEKRAEKDGKFHEPGPLSELERALDRMAAEAQGGARAGARDGATPSP